MAHHRPLGPVRGPIPAQVSLTRVTRKEGLVLLHMRGNLHRSDECQMCHLEALVMLDPGAPRDLFERRSS